MQRREIRWYKFAKPDKRRPVLILTRDSAIPYLGEITVAAITSVIRDTPSEVLLTKVDGMPRESVINLDHVYTVSKGKIGPMIAVLSEHKMAAVGVALRFALGFGTE